jgi:hypothetical protein
MWVRRAELLRACCAQGVALAASRRTLGGVRKFDSRREPYFDWLRSLEKLGKSAMLSSARLDRQFPRAAHNAMRI